jgi:hypothetical protein
VPADRLAELVGSRRHRVAEDVAVEGLFGALADRPRSRRGRLAGDQVDQVAVGAPSGGRGRQEVHHVEGRHGRPGRHRESMGLVLHHDHAPSRVVSPVVGPRSRQR